MPYPNEHAGRLHEPELYEKGAEKWVRITRKHDGKEYAVIRGTRKSTGKLEDQAYRYPKDTWTEAEARKHAKDHDAIIFEPATGEEVKESILEEANEFRPGRVDRDAKIIYDVPFLSSASQNKSRSGKVRKYSDVALDEGVGYFEGASVFIGHKRERDFKKEFAGEMRDIKRDDNGKLRGNWHVIESQSWVFDLAERFPTKAGMSIYAVGRTWEDKTNEIVEGFVHGARRSIDLVPDPATVRNLLESKEDPNLELEEKLKGLEEQIKTLTEQNQHLTEEKGQLTNKVKQLEEKKTSPAGGTDKTYVEDLEKRLVEQQATIGKLQESIGTLEDKAKDAERCIHIEKLLRESKRMADDVTMRVLMRTEDDTELKALIENLPSEKVRNIISSGATWYRDGGGTKEERKELTEQVEKALGM